MRAAERAGGRARPRDRRLRRLGRRRERRRADQDRGRDRQRVGPVLDLAALRRPGSGPPGRRRAFVEHLDDRPMRPSWRRTSRPQTLKRPDGVVVAPFASSAFVSPVRRLMRDGVPVAVVGGADLDRPRALPGVPDLPSDQLHVAGRADGEQVHGAGKLGILGGLPGVDLEAVRVDPFVAALAAANPALEPLPIEYEAFDSTKAATIVGCLARRPPGPQGDLGRFRARRAGCRGGGAAARPDGEGADLRVRRDALPGGSAQARRDLSAHRPVSASAGGAGRRGARALSAAPKRTGPVPAGRPQSVDVDSLVLTPANVDSPEGQRFVYRTEC